MKENQEREGGGEDAMLDEVSLIAKAPMENSPGLARHCPAPEAKGKS